MSNKFPKQVQTLFIDTQGRGGITVRGIQLATEDDVIEGPAEIAEEVRPHGFIRLEEWFDSMLVPNLEGKEGDAIKEELARVQQERFAAVKKYPQLEGRLTGAERVIFKKVGSKKAD